MQALSQQIILDSGDIVTMSTDPVTDGGFMTITIQHGQATISSSLSRIKWGELLRKGESVAMVASIA